MQIFSHHIKQFSIERLLTHYTLIQNNMKTLELIKEYKIPAIAGAIVLAAIIIAIIEIANGNFHHTIAL